MQNQAREREAGNRAAGRADLELEPEKQKARRPGGLARTMSMEHGRAFGVPRSPAGEPGSAIGMPAKAGFAFQLDRARPQEDDVIGASTTSTITAQAKATGATDMLVEPGEVSLLVRHETDQSLLDPWTYLMSFPGKNVRSKLIDAFQMWLGVPEDKIIAIKQIVGYLHTASLLIDDIEDNSQLRRGQPVAHTIYGVPMTLNSANYVYFLAQQKAIKLNSVQALVVFTEEMLNLHRGQGRDILWRDSSRCPSEAEYIDMVKDKTGGLFRLAVRLLLCFGTAAVATPADGTTPYGHAYIELADQMAVYFQVRDDLINLASPSYQKNKSFCEDLTEGKYSFPIIHSIHTDPGDHRLESILKQRPSDQGLKLLAVGWMRKTGSFDYTIDFLANLHADITHRIRELGGHPTLEHIMAALVKDVDECRGLANAGEEDE